jgi:hypothetical protein
MSSLLQILLTSTFTIIGGVVVFAISQLLTKFMIEPIHEQSKAIWATADALLFYANIYSGPGGLPKYSEQAAINLRRCATELLVRTHALPKYNYWEKRCWVLSEVKIFKAYRNLIFLSNSLQQGSGKENREARKAIAEALCIDYLFSDLKKMVNRWLL